MSSERAPSEHTVADPYGRAAALRHRILSGLEPTQDDRELMLTMWSAQLSALEEALDDIERVLGSGGTPSVSWAPPEGMPPMPPELLVRARAILDRQIAAASEVARRASSTQAEIALSRDIEATTPESSPLYLDTTA